MRLCPSTQLLDLCNVPFFEDKYYLILSDGLLKLVNDYLRCAQPLLGIMTKALIS